MTMNITDPRVVPWQILLTHRRLFAHQRDWEPTFDLPYMSARFLPPT